MTAISLAELCKQISERVPSLGIQLREPKPEHGFVLVASATEDSRNIDTASLFCAIRGAHVDGHDYIDAAIASGAMAVLVERGCGPVATTVPIVEVSSTAAALGPVSALLSVSYTHLTLPTNREV